MSDDEYDNEFMDKQSGFDRGINYEETKDQLIKKYKQLSDSIPTIDTTKKQAIVYRQMIYTLIAMTQLRNGCRISESVRCFLKYSKDNKFHKSVVVKISKSDAAKINKAGEKIKPKPRYRNIILQDWVKVEDEKKIFDILESIPKDRLKQRVLDFLLKNFKFNTHSLRYARINYLLNTKKQDIATVAKYIGHNNLDTIMIYCQKKNVEKMDNIDE